MDNLRGAALMIGSMGLFAVEDLLIKKAALMLPVGEILFVLGLFSMLLFGGLVLMQRQSLMPRELRHPYVLMRNGSEIVGTFGFVTALALTDLSSASAILQALPLAVTLMAALFLGETVGWRRWSAISVGFFGVLLIVRPGTDGFEPASLYAVLGVLAFALRDLTTRIAPKALTSIQLAQWGYAMMMMLGLAMVQSVGGLRPIPHDAVWLLVGIVFIGALGYYMVVEALRISDLSAIAPFRYSRLIFAMALAILFLGERPDAFTLAGAALIIASGLYALARERALFTEARQG